MPPEARLVGLRARRLALPAELPLSIDLEASDDDGASGGVLRESLRLGACPLFDGLTDGDRDGLLHDEQLRLGLDGLCQAVSRCRIPDGLTDLTYEVVDCGGNRGRDSRRVELDLPRSICTRGTIEIDRP